MSYYENTTDEKAKQETFRCIILAVIVVFGGLCAMIYGFIWLDHTEITAEDIHVRRRMDKSIKTLRQDFENHTHIYNGKPK